MSLVVGLYERDTLIKLKRARLGLVLLPIVHCGVLVGGVGVRVLEAVKVALIGSEWVFKGLPPLLRPGARE